VDRQTSWFVKPSACILGIEWDHPTTFLHQTA